MMKNNFYKMALLSFILLILINSCQREDLENSYQNSEYQNSKINSVKKISFQEMLDKIPAGTIDHKLVFSATLKNLKSIEEFDIDSTNVNQIHFGESGTSYVMKVFPKSEYNENEELYNLTITQNNGEIVKKITKYILLNGEVVVDDDHVEIVYSSKMDQSNNCELVILPCDYGYYHNDEECEAGGWTIIVMCGGGGSGGNPTGDGPTVPTGPGGYNPQDGGGGTNGTSEPTTPCAKTKSILANSQIQPKIQDLKNHVANGSPGGEKGWKFNKVGNPTQTTQNSEHQVNFGDPSLLKGGYHNHTGKGVDIFSATDVATLIEIARYNGSSNPTNAFMGLVAPNGIHYVIRFDGGQTDLPQFGTFSETDKLAWNVQQKIFSFSLLKKTEYSQTINGKKTLNDKGLERILFDTLTKMGIDDRIVVQKIDTNNNVSTVIQNDDLTTSSFPCS